MMDATGTHWQQIQPLKGVSPDWWYKYEEIRRYWRVRRHAEVAAKHAAKAARRARTTP